tara:strand:- start:2148 stop:2975 length:828 start_codon:yes stop_codon:yes gene_type:complete
MYNNKKYYDILQLDTNCTEQDIKKAYRQLSLKYHPDKNINSATQFNNINEAYTHLLEYHKNNFNNKYGDNNNYDNNNNNNNNNNNDNYSSINIYKKHNQELNDDIIINLEITYEDSYNGANVPININRSINNNNIFKYEQEKIYIPLPKSIDDNEIIIINNKGNCVNGNFSDIKVVIKLKEHLIYFRDGLNLIYISSINFKESLIGVDFNITHLNNNVYKINNKKGEIIHNNTSIVIKNLGFQRDSYFGNLIIKFKIDYPKTLSKTTIEKLKEIL